MDGQMYFKISRIPDVSLNKYASLSDTGVEGILERHTAFLRQWHRISVLGKISMHLIIDYDPNRESSKRIEIGFLIDSQENDEHYTETVQQAFSASPLSEFFSFERKDEDIESIINNSYSNISMILKNERFLYPTATNGSPSFFYVVPMWEMQDESRLYSMMKMMQSFNVKCEFRLDLYADNISETMQENFKKPLHWLRNNCKPSTHVNMIGERIESDNDSAANDVLKSYEDFLSKLDTSPAFYSHINMFCDDERIGQILLESAASEAIKEGYDKIVSYQGNYNGLSYYKDIDRGICDNEAPESLKLLPVTYTLEEIDAFFRFPTLYDGETIEIPKETAPSLTSRDGIFLGQDSNGYDVYLPLRMFKKHMFICGVPGAGKTNTMLRIASTLWKEYKVPFIVLEPAKKEYRELALFGIDELVIFSPNANTKFPLRINPFEFPIGLTLSEHISSLDAVFEGAFPLAPPTPFLLDRSIENIYAAKGWNNDDINDGTKSYPTLSELYKQFEEELKQTSYDGEIRGNIRSALEMRIGSLLRREMADIFDVSNSSFTPEELMERPIIVELEALGEGPANFTNLLICSLIRETLRVSPYKNKDKPIRHIIMIEEAHNLIAPTAQALPGTEVDPKTSATAFIVKMLAEVRALREGIIIADQLPTAMAPEVIKNTNIKLVHRLTSQDDRGLVGSTMSANEVQIEKLATFSPGQSLIVYEGLLKPYEMQVAELPSHGKDTPNDDELYELIKLKPGFKKNNENDFVYRCIRINRLIDEFSNLVGEKIKKMTSENYMMLSRNQKYEKVKLFLNYNTLVSTNKSILVNDIKRIVKKCNIYPEDIKNKNINRVLEIEKIFQKSLEKNIKTLNLFEG